MWKIVMKTDLEIKRGKKIGLLKSSIPFLKGYMIKRLICVMR
jgi:hypothetical protein